MRIGIINELIIAMCIGIINELIIPMCISLINAHSTHAHTRILAISLQIMSNRTNQSSQEHSDQCIDEHSSHAHILPILGMHN